MTCEERQDQILLYAAEALEPAERDEVRSHLGSGCPRCAGSLAEAEAILAHLPLALEPVAPSRELRARLLERIRPEGSVAPLEKSEPLHVVPFPEARSADRWLDAWLKPAIAAGLAAAAVYGLTALPLRRERASLETEIAHQAERIRALESSAEQEAETARLLRSREAVVAMLAGSEPQPEAWGRILWDREHGTVRFYTGNLRPPGVGRTYELWLITEGQEKIPAGTFDVDASRTGFLVARVPKEIGKIVLAAVTDEPAGGVPQPTGKIHLLGKLL